MRPIKLSLGKSVYSTRVPRRQISQIAEIGLFPIHPAVCPDDQERAQYIADLLNGTHEKDSLPAV